MVGYTLSSFTCSIQRQSRNLGKKKSRTGKKGGGGVNLPMVISIHDS